MRLKAFDFLVLFCVIATLIVAVADILYFFHFVRTQGISIFDVSSWTRGVSYLSSATGLVLTFLTIGPWILLFAYFWWNDGTPLCRKEDGRHE